jgi:predicted RNA binding protein YcfA (HicA-like mRNA interferase family)
MAGKLPAINGRRVIGALTRAGFVLDRVVGSHHVMVFPGDVTRTVTVPVHSGRDLKPGTLRSIIRQAGFTVEEFTELIKTAAEWTMSLLGYMLH